MYSFNEISIDHINRLKDIELSQLLHVLLRCEAQKEKLEGWDMSVPFNITTGDAGSDGKLLWTGNPTKTHRFESKFVLFQNKATDLFPSDCYEEILEKKKDNHPRKLKQQIQQLVEANGTYILFTNRSIVDKGKEERTEKFREAIKDTGHTNYENLQIEIYDANKIKDWVNEYIRAILLVQEFNGIKRPLGFRSWEEWGVDIRVNESPYQKNALIDAWLELIQKTLIDENVIRIAGHSGLGKTRLVFETFRAENGGLPLQNRMAYYDLGITANHDEITNYIISHRLQQSGIIVIDNCDIEAHQKLSSIAKPQGNIKIITIGLDDKKSLDDFRIRLDRNEQKDLVSAIVNLKLGTTHSISDREYIINLSEGYPWMAVRFSEAVLKTGLDNLNKYPLDEFIKKLLFNANEQEYDVISACSVFSAFGFLDDSFSRVISKEVQDSLQQQMDFIRTQIHDGSITETKFKSICNKFRGEDIIEKRGTYYIVKPTVLAIQLASQWLINTPHNKIKGIIEGLRDVSLEEKFLDRLTDLDQLDKAKDIVADLWGPGSFFGSAEVLNTRWGSLLFRYVVEVNPKATAKSLEVAFMKITVPELKQVKEGRRNLVWALEKLVFRKETFDIAAKLLYQFALAENETWANNATSQFLHLFQIYLPGTEVNYIERLKVIKWGLQKNDSDYNRIAIMALGRGITNDHFNRIGGSESQGSGAPLKDYEPATWQEVFDYWSECLELLSDAVCKDQTNSQIAREAISKVIRRFVRDGQFRMISAAIRKVMECSNELWPDALSNLKRTLAYEKELPVEVVREIHSLVDELTPKDLADSIYLKVIKPDWAYDDETDESGNRINKQTLKALRFAEEIVQQKLPIDAHLEKLLQGEQRQGFNFGFRLGELVPEKKDFFEKTVAALKNIPQKEQNPEFLIGFVLGTKDNTLINQTFDQFVNDLSLAHHAFYVARLIHPNFNQFEKLFALVEFHGFSISYFLNFQYGRPLDHLTSSEIITICSRISDRNDEGRWIALALVFMYCYGDGNRWKECREFLKNLVSEPMNFQIKTLQTMEVFHWKEVVEKILTEEKESYFARKITEQIVSVCSEYDVHYEFEHYATEILKTLFDVFFADIWDILGAAILSKNYIFFMHLKNMIGTKNGWMGGNGILFENEERNKIIFEWCKTNAPKSAIRIANMMPLGIQHVGQIVWHPFSKMIIDEFGNNEKMLSELSANMGTYGTTGSRVPYLEGLKDLVEQLKNHPLDKVRKWAERKSEYLDKEIKLEELSNEEDQLT
jgi:hypothetical protein